MGAAGAPQGAAGPAPAPQPSTQGADMKRAYEALGIACPTSVAALGFPRAPLAPLTRLTAPRPPGLTDVVQQPNLQQLFAQQNQPDLQQQQLVSNRCSYR